MLMIDATKWEEFYKKMTDGLKPYDHYDDGYRDAMDNVDDWMDGNQVEAEPVRQWISVEERLPKEWEAVLVRSWCGYTECAVWLGIPGKWRCTWDHTLLESEITHWMPLPEPPNGAKMDKEE